jgi:membrane carboxypeptidase/penicillin-binding protein
MMQRAVSAGTATAARRPGEVLAAKTGTTSDFLDAWFLAIRPDHVVAVWIGADDHLPLGPDETGAEAALPAARAILDTIPAPPGDFGVPDDVVLIPEGGWTLSLPRGTPDALRRLRQARPVAPPPPAAGVEGAESAAGAEGGPPSTSGEDAPLDAAPVEDVPAPPPPAATVSP